MADHINVTHLRAMYTEGAAAPSPVAFSDPPGVSEDFLQICELAAVAPDIRLPDQQLLLLVLSCWGRRPVPHQAVERLLEQFLDFERIIAAAPADLAYFGGLNGAEILALKSIHIAALRVVRTSIDKRPIISDSKDLHNYLIASLARERTERLCVLFLDSANHLIADEIMARGDEGSVSISNRDLLLRALRWNATALILAHNHPSGDPMPSMQDIVRTQEIVEAAALFGITVHDHVIVSHSGICSLRAEGLLRKIRA